MRGFGDSDSVQLVVGWGERMRTPTSRDAISRADVWVQRVGVRWRSPQPTGTSPVEVPARGRHTLRGSTHVQLQAGIAARLGCPDSVQLVVGWGERMRTPTSRDAISRADVWVQRVGVRWRSPQPTGTSPVEVPARGRHPLRGSTHVQLQAGIAARLGCPDSVQLVVGWGERTRTPTLREAARAQRHVGPARWGSLALTPTYGNIAS